jgi:hypothetical protein
MGSDELPKRKSETKGATPGEVAPGAISVPSKKPKSQRKHEPTRT